MSPYAIVTAALRGDPAPAPTNAAIAALSELAGLHGVGSLLYRKLEGTPAWARWPEALRAELAEAAREQVAAEMARKRGLQEVLAAFAEEGIEPLILKGAALAYTLYDEPSSRTRGDSDLLIRPADRERATRILRSLGYEPWLSAGGELASYQQLFAGPHHHVDLHWKISNAQIFAAAFPYDELAAEAQAIPALGPQARSLSPVHALLLALAHRAVHVNAPYYVHDVPYYEANRLIWLYDIHLLAQTLDHDAWTRFVDHARDKRLRAVCLDGLRATERALHTPLPSRVVDALAAPGWPELSAAYLRRGGLRQIAVELQALPRWSERATLLRDLLLPPADYMFERYDTEREALLPWLYLRRAVGGAARMVRRKGRESKDAS